LYQRILLCYHGTSHSAVALRQGTDIARFCEAELHVLGIVATTGGLAIAQAAGPSDLLGQERTRVQRALADADRDLTAKDINVITALREGDPATEILAYAHAIRAQLTVLGHSDKGALTRWFQGSTAGKLLHYLPCSLLIAI